MCWTTFNNICMFEKTAEKDIEVFKILSADNTPFFRYGKPYKVGKECPNIILDIKRYNGRGTIEKGYHSYSKEKCCHKKEKTFSDIAIENVKHKATNTAISFYCYGKLGCKVADFIIPKGTKYYENEYGEIVSETIKMV